MAVTCFTTALDALSVTVPLGRGLGVSLAAHQGRLPAMHEVVGEMLRSGMLAEVPSMVSPKHHDRVVFQPRLSQRREHTADLRVHVAHAGGVCPPQQPRVPGIRFGIAPGVAVVSAEFAARVPAGRPGGLRGGGNMAAVHLASAIGGDLFLGFVSAVAFATILAVVAGLTLAGASAVSHDIYASVIRHGEAKSDEELRVSRITVLVLAVVAIILGIVFQEQNVAFIEAVATATVNAISIPENLVHPAIATRNQSYRSYRARRNAVNGNRFRL